MYEKVKLKNSDSIVINKQGRFYISYGIDAKMLNYLFGYELKEIEEQIGVRFIKIDKVLEKLDNLKINYVVVDIESKKYRNNRYKTVLRVMEIVDKLSNLNNNDFNEKFYLLKS